MLQIPEDKVWTEDDLNEEFNLKLGLHLLYNKINGKTELHFGKSIHIRYQAFPKDVMAMMEESRKVAASKVKTAKAKAI
jgi:hypothetical protein